MEETGSEGLRFRKRTSAMDLEISQENDAFIPKATPKTLEQELEETGSVTLCFGSDVALNGSSVDDSEEVGDEDHEEDEEDEEDGEDEEEDDKVEPGCSGFDDIDFETLTCQVPGLVQAKVLVVRGEEMYKNMKDNMQVRAERIRDNMQDAAEKMQDNVHVMFKNVQDVTEKVSDNVCDAAEKVQVLVKTNFHDASEKAEKIAKKAFELGRSGWYLVSHIELPHWLKDNDFLSDEHRPPMPSFRLCFKSMFKIHTETGNIWTHLIGFLAFIAVAIFVYARPLTASIPFPENWQEKLVFGAFFTGVILCLGFSWIFHTVFCHSATVSTIFSRLDYSGIALLIMGSFVPPLYYGFYCSRVLKISYMVVICTLGIISIVLSIGGKFNTPKYRTLRAGVFLTFGCSGVVPAIHFMVAYGVEAAHRQASVGWMGLMGLLYITGAIIYASRIPERYFPGKFNLCFQSHQIFHVLVVAAASVHLYGICQMAFYRFSQGSVCPD